jgi:alpha-tubulin suppressor-like RCC1 family protein
MTTGFTLARALLVTGAVLGAACTPGGLAASAAHAASGGTIEHWGAFTGDGNQNGTRLTPTAMSLPGTVTEVGTSNSTQYALLSNGTVYAWGQGGHGELGNGHTANSFTTPVQVKFPAGVKIAFIPTDVMPFNSAFAVDTTGHVWGWGMNAGGEFCQGNAKQHTTPVKLPLSHVTILAGAYNHALYDADGTVYACGSNKYGALGDGTTTSSQTPVKVTGLNGQQVTTLVAAWGNSGALLANGDYYDWGYDGGGQIGNGTVNESADVPVKVSLPGPVAQAAQGGSVPENGQTQVMLSDGALYAWGNGSHYQIGDGKKTNEPSPVQFRAPAGVTYKTLVSGGATSYAISTAGNVYAWGSNIMGQIGNGTLTNAQHPVEVASGATLISATAYDVEVSP